MSNAIWSGMGHGSAVDSWDVDHPMGPIVTKVWNGEDRYFLKVVFLKLWLLDASIIGITWEPIRNEETRVQKWGDLPPYQLRGSVGTKTWSSCLNS